MEREADAELFVCSQTANQQENCDYNQVSSFTVWCSEFNQLKSPFFSLSYLCALADSRVREDLLNL